MSRAPLPAWRRLFAAGGAPAAAHALLSRAPATEHLLDPVTRVRMAAETSLDALARPLDVSRVLSRVLDGMAAVEPNASADGDAPIRSRSGAARISDTAKPTSRTRLIGHAPAEAAAERGGSRRSPSSHSRLATNAAPPADTVRRVEREPTTTRENHFTAATMPSVVARTMEAQAGAHSRVVVDAPVNGIERLLAIGTSAPAPTTRGRPTRQTNGPLMEPSASDAARLLASAVDRVASRRAALPEAASRGEPRSHAATHDDIPMTERTDSGSSDGARGAENTSTVVSNASSNGGFRGLARRTLLANGNGQLIPVRLEPEARTPSDIPLDTLDARVTESLVRLLEREARRHGVDLAESRT